MPPIWLRAAVTGPVKRSPLPVRPCTSCSSTSRGCCFILRPVGKGTDGLGGTSLAHSASPPSVTPPQTAPVEHLLPLAPSCSGLSPLVLVSSPDCLSSGAGLPFFTAGSSSFLLLALPRPSAQQVLSSTGRFCVGPVKRLLIGSFLV